MNIINRDREINQGVYLILSQTKFKETRFAMTKDMTMVELVALIEEAGQELMRFLLESRLMEDPRNQPVEAVCRACGNKLRIQNTQQHRIISTAIGKMAYQRAYGVCDRCGHTGAPLDEALGIPPTGPSVEAVEKVCHAAVVGRSFEDGREILKVHRGMKISAKHVRCLAEKEGRGLVEERKKEVAAYRENGQLQTNGEAPNLLVVTADGGRVQMRGKEADERWKEDKIGVVYDAVPHPETAVKPGEYKGAQAKTKTYAATMENWESMGWMLRLEAEKRGYGKARETVFIADGARHIREMKNLHFMEAAFVLDWAHAVEHLSDCAKAFFGEGDAEGVTWYEKHKTLLWNGSIDNIIKSLQQLSERAGAPRKEDPESSSRRRLHQNAYSYFPNNKEAMDYPAFRAKGWPIGSGVAEGAIKQFSLRLKGSEKFWNESCTGAEEMLALCALYHSEDGRWDAHWRKRAQPR